MSEIYAREVKVYKDISDALTSKPDCVNFKRSQGIRHRKNNLGFLVEISQKLDRLENYFQTGKMIKLGKAY